MAVSNTKEAVSHIRVLIVDDDPSQRSLLQSFLSGQGFQILTATSGEQALALLDTKEINIMISDVRMPGISGLETLRKTREKYPTLPVLLVTAYADIRDAVNAMRDGAVNYLEKPIDLDELLSSVQKAAGIRERSRLQIPDGLQLPDTVVVHSPLMIEVFREAALVASSDSRILITGESGVGKEVVADVIHAWSPRASKPLIKVNCAAIPENLLESELFGHEKGSFTGATHQRIGRFEEANGGTILLDEIVEMSPALQAKLLRITQEGTYQRVGSNQEYKTNTRILASTNRNLEQEVEKGNFREDLFFRLNVMEIYIPPLRDRKADIIPLAIHFAQTFKQGSPRLSAAVTHCFEEYHWPGNVRELRNAMERATLMARGELIIPEHLPRRILKSFTALENESVESSPARRMEDIEREAILHALRENRYNRTETARSLGISRRALTYKLQHYAKQGYEIDPE
ncbi:MAG: sigma-54-dependent Fis family transcriptional regulator [Candidatus Omnitrophota bacterium]|jgi:DNA-binding NtrC family response regulator|nr:MAG: sigma-54-dependent Fis family transcriptional regulator [Candidatus Omnitrophota bacterium]